MLSFFFLEQDEAQNSSTHATSYQINNTILSQQVHIGIYSRILIENNPSGLKNQHRKVTKHKVRK